jgi:DnaJ-class molecular chaperone
MASVQFKDYYKSLGINRDATEKEIRSAYLKLARKFHPDKNPGDAKAEERFKEINEANEVLSDPDKRKMYDRFGEDWQRYRDAGFTGDEPAGRPHSAGGTGGPTPDFGTWFTGQTGGQRVDFGEASQQEGFSDFFRTLFGSRGNFTNVRPTRQRGDDLETSITVSFEEAYKGTTRRVDVQLQEPCSTCGGVGFVRESPCPTCDATGYVNRRRSLEVKVPAGIATGSRIRVAGQGGPGVNGGPNGDVYLRVTVADDPRFERQGDDLRTDVQVPLYTAMLGGEVVVTTPTGKVALTIPPETPSGKVFRLRGKGMPKRGSGKGHGDLLARVAVILPSNLSEREQELYKELRSLRPSA